MQHDLSVISFSRRKSSKHSAGAMGKKRLLVEIAISVDFYLTSRVTGNNWLTIDAGSY
jgi:hypothetical protein